LAKKDASFANILADYEEFIEQDRLKNQEREAENQRLGSKLIFEDDFELENPMVDVEESKSFSQKTREPHF